MKLRQDWSFYDQMHTSLLPIANNKKLFWPYGLKNVS